MTGFETTIPASMLSSVQDLSRGRAVLSCPVLGEGQLVLKSIAVSGGTSAEVDSGWDLPSRAVVMDVWIEVTTIEATGSTKTLDVGLLSSESGGDADGFLDGVSVATAGMRRGLAVATVGSNNTYLGAAGTHTIGALLTGLLIAGEDTAAGGDGYLMKSPHVAASVTSKSISYSRGSTLTEFVGKIWFLYMLPMTDTPTT